MTISNHTNVFVSAIGCCFIFLYTLVTIVRTEAEVTFTRRLFVDIDAYVNSKITVTSGIANHGSCGKLCRDKSCVSFAYDGVNGECTLYDREFCNQGPQSEESMVFFCKVQRDWNSDPADCSEVNTGVYCSGIHRITPPPGGSFDVYCDLDTAGGPWTVIQNRKSKDVDFYRNWMEYKQGFGDLMDSYWIGNDKLHLLTSQTKVLRVEVWNDDVTMEFIEYSGFQVADEVVKYRMSYTGQLSGTLESTMFASGQKFTTFDSDNDKWNVGNCANAYKGGWWYKKCGGSNLNGRFIGEGNNYAMQWGPSRQRASMMIK